MITDGPAAATCAPRPSVQCRADRGNNVTRGYNQRMRMSSAVFQGDIARRFADQEDSAIAGTVEKIVQSSSMMLRCSGKRSGRQSGKGLSMD